MSNRTTFRRAGFTLVEVLIVVIILGILAAIVIPQFANATAASKAANVADQVQLINRQVTLYRAQHNDVLPNLIAGWAPLTMASDVTGNTSNPSGQTFGPYLPTPLTNPLTGSQAIAATASTSVGWVFDAATGLVHGVTAAGAKTDDGSTVIP